MYVVKINFLVYHKLICTHILPLQCPWNYCIETLALRKINTQSIKIKTDILKSHMYGTGKKKRLSYLVGNLVATNWPIEKALHAIIGYNQIPTK